MKSIKSCDSFRVGKAVGILSSRWQGVDDERDRKEGGQGRKERCYIVFTSAWRFHIPVNVLPLHSVAHEFHKTGQCLLHPWWLSLCFLKARGVSIVLKISSWTNLKQGVLFPEEVTTTSRITLFLGAFDVFLTSFCPISVILWKPRKVKVCALVRKISLRRQRSAHPRCTLHVQMNGLERNLRTHVTFYHFDR